MGADDRNPEEEWYWQQLLNEESESHGLSTRSGR